MILMDSPAANGRKLVLEQNHSLIYYRKIQMVSKISRDFIMNHKFFIVHAMIYNAIDHVMDETVKCCLSDTSSHQHALVII